MAKMTGMKWRIAMPEREPIRVVNLDTYGNEPMPWSRAHAALDIQTNSDSEPGQRTTFLNTTRPDGRPHSAAVGALWYDGDFYFTSGPETRKSKNLAINPAGTIAAGLDGIDLVLEGAVERTTDSATFYTLARIYRGGGWPVEVAGDAFTAEFSAPSAGPPPWNLYRFRVNRVFGVPTREPWGATRWDFA